MRSSQPALWLASLGAACLIVAAILTRASRPAAPAPAGALSQPPAAEAAGTYPGNYCASCHAASDDRPATVLAWNGGIDGAAAGGCAAAARVRQEVYYTERLLQAVQHARASAGSPGAAVDDQIESARQGYSRLLDAPVTSLDGFTAEAQSLRFRLGKTYAELNSLDQAARWRKVLAVAGLVTLALVLASVWGLRIATRLARAQAPGPARWPARLWLPLAAVFVLFSLPIFQQALPPAAVSDPEGQARLAALDVAGRALTSADLAQTQAWLLALTGAGWQSVDRAQGEKMLAAAEAAAGQTPDRTTLWGEAEAVREGTVGSPDDLASGDLLAGELEAAQGRAWGIRLAASAWDGVDTAQAQLLLQQALAGTPPGAGEQRDLDLRALAVTWAALDPSRGVELADQVKDPALRAWALWEIAGMAHDPALFRQAAAAARGIAAPVERARALAEIAQRSGDASYLAGFAAILGGTPGPARAYALAQGAAAGNPALADQIDPAFPEARAYAWYASGRPDKAWAETARIADPFEQARARAAIAARMGRADHAREIADPTQRDRALRDIAVAQGDAGLAKTITSAYYKVQSLTALGQYQAAAEAAAGLRDFYPLRGLAVAWAPTDPPAALALVDKMDRDTDRAEALRAVAVASGDPGIFERALAMALAARAQGDVAAPVEASLALGHAFALTDKPRADAAYAQAYQLAEKISPR